MSSFDDGDVSFVATFDPTGERASTTVVTAVAAVRGADPATLSPLYDVIEPDALDSLCSHADRSDCVHRLWFTYEGLDVCVRSDGEVRVVAPSSSEDTT